VTFSDLFWTKKIFGEKIIFRKFGVRPLIFFRHLNFFSKNIFFRQVHILPACLCCTRMSIYHLRASLRSTRMCVLMTKYLFYPHVCVLPACFDHTLAPCAALLPLFFSTPYRSHARNFVTNSNFCTPFSPLDRHLDALSDGTHMSAEIFNPWPSLGATQMTDVYFCRFSQTPLAFEREKNIALQVSNYCVLYGWTRNWTLFRAWKSAGWWTSRRNSTAKRSAETTLKIGVFRHLNPKFGYWGSFAAGKDSLGDVRGAGAIDQNWIGSLESISGDLPIVYMRNIAHLYTIGHMHVISLQIWIFPRRFHFQTAIWILHPTDPPSTVTFWTVDRLRGDRSEKNRFFCRFLHTPLAFEREKNTALQVSHYCVLYRWTRNWTLFRAWKSVRWWTTTKNSNAKRSAETTLIIPICRRF
jgi:hypothetical protein